MRMRGLLIALLLLAALAGGIWWSNKAKQAEASKPSADASSPKILSVPETRIARIEIQKAGGDAVIERHGTRWELTAPKPLPADQDAVSSMMTTLSSLSADRVVEDKAGDLSQYGLIRPALALLVTEKGGKTRRLLIGDEAPTGSGFYARVEGDPRVFTIASYTKTTLDKSPNDLRDKRLLTFDSDKLTRVELLAKGQDLEFGKNNQNDWQILKPRPLRADGGQIEELIRKLKDAKMDLSVSAEDARKAAAAFNSGAQVALAKVTDAAGTQQVQVRKDKDKNYYAKSSAVEGVYKVAGDLGDGLDKGLDDFRNKKVFDFGWSDPSKIEVRDGARQTVYTKSGDKWMSGAKQMDFSSLQNLVDKLRDLAAAKFPDQGFTTPALEFAVTSNDGKRVEKAALAKAGNDWLAKRENEPALYQLDPKAADDLQKAVSSVKEAAPPPKKK
jgi:hypothetical protein